MNLNEKVRPILIKYILNVLVSNMWCETAVRDLVFGGKIPVAAPGWCSRRPFFLHTWLSQKWLQLVGKGGVKQGSCQHTPSRFEVWLRVFVCVCQWGRERQRIRVYCCLTQAIISWRATAGATLILLFFPPPPSLFIHPLLSPFPSSPHPLPYLCFSSTPWPWPSACSFAHPPMFANHFFPCQQVNCFVLPFPAFITLCKLSDMSSTGARQSTHCANAEIMRFGIINEDKLAVAVLLSARARLHYSLNLPEKMT